MSISMLTVTTYSEAGGVGKTTIAANVAVADARNGRDVLVIDLDPQEGSLSYLLGVADLRSDDEADNLVRHLIDRPKGDFDELVQEAEAGVDIVPAHNMLERLTEYLLREKRQREDLGDDWNENGQLLRVLQDAGVPDRYDTLIVDPPATADAKLYNGIVATRNLVLPIEPSGKGQQSVAGLEDLVDGLERELSMNVGVLAAVPIGYKDTRDQRAILEEIEALGYDVPVTIRERSSLFEGCWREQCSAFKYVEEHRSRTRDYEQETLDEIEALADHMHAIAEGRVEA